MKPTAGKESSLTTSDSPVVLFASIKSTRKDKSGKGKAKGNVKATGQKRELPGKRERRTRPMWRRRERETGMYEFIFSKS